MLELPADVHVLTVVGLILVASQLGGRLSNRINAPRVTGYLLVGLLIGPSLLASGRALLALPLPTPDPRGRGG